jgi:ribonuclease BN (tRNA processing enzyme)
MDAGPGTLARFSRIGLNQNQLDTLFITHLHPDHTLDLATILQVFDSTPNAQRTRPFTIYGCPGTKSFYKRMIALYPAIKPQTYPVMIHEVFHNSFEINGLSIKTAPSGHTKHSISFRVKGPSGSLVFSGDASEQGELVNLAAGADILVCECSFPSDHLNADSAGSLAQKASVKRLVITHRYPPALVVDLAKQIKRNYSGKLSLATDGMQFSI